VKDTKISGVVDRQPGKGC